jgi:protein-L-isoaspartate(D-aspartate) O-methyltransferase
MQHSTRKLNMIESQLRPNNIIDENLIAAFEKVQQEDFLPDSLQNLSYIDDSYKDSLKLVFILKPTHLRKIFKYYKTRVLRCYFRSRFRWWIYNFSIS